jgi:hypothetical protein
MIVMRHLFLRVGIASFTFIIGVLASTIWVSVGGLHVRLPWEALGTLLVLSLGMFWCFTLAWFSITDKEKGNLLFTLIMIASGGLFFVYALITAFVAFFRVS